MNNYCPVCNKKVDIYTKTIKKVYKDNIVDVEYDSLEVYCKECNEPLFNWNVIEQNKQEIYKKIKLKYPGITLWLKE